MSRIEDLIERLCPNGVEYKRLGDICDDIIVPMRDRPKIFDGDIPWCRIEDIEGQYFNRSLSGLAVSDKVIQEMNLKVFPTGTVICSCSASLGSYAINTQPLITNQTFIGLVCGGRINNKYLRYYMETQTNYLRSQASTGTIPYISRKKFEDMKILLPPLEIQKEIVSILDNFTELTNELTTELSLRKKQYQYYCDTLVSLDDGWENVAIKDITTITRGKRFVHADAVEEGVPCIHYGELYTYYGVHANKVKSHIREELRPKMRYASKGDVIVVGAGENNIDIGIGVAWNGDEEVAVHDACYILKHNQNPKYLSYCLRTESYHKQIKKYVSRGKICSILADGIGSAIIPIPPIKEQNRIVCILDTFEALCAELSAEIEARKKQYEYYRDRLLTFKPLETEQ